MTSFKVPSEVAECGPGKRCICDSTELVHVSFSTQVSAAFVQLFILGVSLRVNCSIKGLFNSILLFARSVHPVTLLPSQCDSPSYSTSLLTVWIFSTFFLPFHVTYSGSYSHFPESKKVDPWPYGCWPCEYPLFYSNFFLIFSWNAWIFLLIFSCLCVQDISSVVGYICYKYSLIQQACLFSLWLLLMDRSPFF